VLLGILLSLAASGGGAFAQSDSGAARAELAEGARVYREGDFAAAERHFRRAFELDPAVSKHIKLFIARAVQQQYRPGVQTPENVAAGERAVEAYGEVLREDPSSEDAWKATVFLYGQMKNDEKVREMLTQRAEDESVAPEKRAEALVILASKKWQCSYDVTEQKENKVTVNEPERVLIIYKMPTDRALFEQARGCVAEGLALSERALTLAPEHASGWSYKANLLREAGKLAEMEGDLAAKEDYDRRYSEAYERQKALSEEARKRREAEEEAAPPAPARAPKPAAPRGSVGVKGPARAPVSPDIYRAPAMTPEARKEAEQKLAEARARYRKNPKDADACIWLGRRTAYLGRFDEAIRIYTAGIRLHPRDARFYRHRGHRFITTRRFDEAVKDLERAAELVRDRADEVEPDGLPNARGVPTSTLNSNVYYHLGLAYYLLGDYQAALLAYCEALRFSKNPDMLVATTHWHYMTLRRLGCDEEARRALERVPAGAEVIENHDYLRLIQLYKGEADAERLLADAAKDKTTVGYSTLAYGVGNWHLYNGRAGRALQIFLDIMMQPQRTSFGYIAAEAELERMGVRGHPREPAKELPRRTLH
jgi:tetratricopeptide (TPR) repeat protein